jgi:hypothetical protein
MKSKSIQAIALLAAMMDRFRSRSGQQYRLPGSGTGPTN